MIGHAPRRSGTKVEIDFETGRGPITATFDVPEHLAVDDSGDAVLAVGWLPAMRCRDQLVVEAPVSTQMVGAASRIADIVLTWERALRPDAEWYGRVALEAPARPPTAPGPAGRRGTACFFTGGVDSFHSAIAHRGELDALVFVHGFDLTGDRDSPLNRYVSQHLHRAAQQIGVPLVEIQSNLLFFGGDFGVNWDDYHGAALAAVAHLLAPQFSKVYVPATTTYARLYPLGSHPLLDPLWSSERVEIVHDGADATRIEKLAVIAEHPAARHHLRVCFENRGGAYNCGQCEKCVRTSVAARIAGVEGRFEVLPAPSLRRIAAVDIPGLGLTWQSYADHLRRTGASERLRLAIRAAQLRRRLREHPIAGRWVR